MTVHNADWWEKWRKQDPVGYFRYFEGCLGGEYRGYLDELKKRKPRTWPDYLDEIQERKDFERIFMWIHENMPDLCTCSSCAEVRAYLLRLEQGSRASTSNRSFGKRFREGSS